MSGKNMRIPRIVVDTNVFLSATILKGSSNVLLDLWNDGHFVVLLSPDIFDEYFEVMGRPRFRQDEKDIREIADLLTDKAIAVEPDIQRSVIKEDFSDNKFLECAISGDADFIISGDRHLLNLKQYEGIQILTINQFLKTIRHR